MSKLPEKFGFWTGLYVVAANMIGSGILTISGPMMLDIKSPLFIALIWLVGGILSLAGALILAEMASARTAVGGEYIFVRDGLGRPWAFTYGWSMVVVGFAGPLALLSYTTANYIAPLLSALGLSFFSSALQTNILATAILITFTFLHSLSHKHSSWTQSLTTWFKLGVLIAFMIAVFLKGLPPIEWGNLFPENLTWGKAGVALTQVLFAYSGWNAAVFLAGETKDAKRIIPRCVIMGCLLVTLFYLAMNFAYFRALPQEVLASLNVAQTQRVAEASVEAQFGAQYGAIFAFLVALGVLASVSSYILTGARVCFAMATDGLLHRKAAAVREKTQVPRAASFFLSTVALIFLWSGTFEDVLNFTAVGLTILGNLVILPILFLRQRKDYHPALKAPFYPGIVYFFLFLNTATVAATFWETPVTSILSVAATFAPLPLYYLLERGMLRARRQSREEKPA